MLVVASLFGVTRVLALCPEPPPKVCAAYFESDAVYRAMLVGRRIVQKPAADADDIEYSFQVLEALKGPARKTVLLRSENSSGRWVGDRGKTYVVFASKGRIGGSCSSIDDASRVAQTLAEIRALRGVKGSVIEGEVADGKIYGATTNTRGEFRIPVPPGRYTVAAGRRPTSVYSSDASQPFSLAAGQCTQFQFSDIP